MSSQKVAVVGKNCVACGNCTDYCPMQAITIDRGVRAKVDTAKCVGCAKCEKACPGGIITIHVRERYASKKVV